MKNISLPLAISLSMSAGFVEAGGPGAFSVFDAPSSRLIVRTEQTIASPNVMAFTNNMVASAGEHMNFVRSLAIDNTYVYELPEMVKGTELAGLINELKSMAGVISVEEDAMLQRQTVNDEYYKHQWHYFESTGGINVEKAWEKSTGEGVYVAVVDTGILYYDDISANVIGGYDFISDTNAANDGNGRDADPTDPGDWVVADECYSGSEASSSSWHGTHVAGTIAAITNNSIGVAGVAYNAKIIPVRVLGKCGGYMSDIFDGMVWASGGNISGVPVNPYPADVINMSLGGTMACSSTFQSAVDTAIANGSTIVVAAGNENENASGFTPANCDNLITVAANDRSGNRAYYSNYGSKIDVSAPGGDTTEAWANGVLSTSSDGEKTAGSAYYSYYQGTSMASPHVAGVAALMKAAAPLATPAQIKSALVSSVRELPGTCTKGCGAGIVDADAAVSAITGSSSSTTALSFDWLASAASEATASTSNSLNLENLSLTAGSKAEFTIDVPASASSITITISGGTGEVEVYAKPGSAPTSSDYSCYAYQSGGSGSCTASNDGATWYIHLVAVSAFSDVTLNATWE